MAPEITKIESVEFAYPIEDVGTDHHGFNLVYEPGTVTERKLFGIKIHTDEGITGEYVGGNSPGAAQINTFANFLVGKNPLKREFVVVRGSVRRSTCPRSPTGQCR